MFSLLSPITNLIKKRSVNPDNAVFKLHYQYTALIFLGASGLLLGNQAWGRSVDCINDGSHSMEEIFKNTIDNFCWMTSLFTVKELACGVRGKEVAYGGIGTLTLKNSIVDAQVTYRFLFFVLFLQGISFLLPHYLWKSWESGKMKMLSAGMDNPLFDDKEKITGVTRYLLLGPVTGSMKYAFRFHFCELMNLIIIGLNIWFLDLLFQHEFIGYGFKMFSNIGELYDPQCDDPIRALFPKVAKCNWNTFGPSGSVQKMDSLCLLMANDFNVIFFKFIWFWLAFLLIVSVDWLLFRVATIYSQFLRSWLLHRMVGTAPLADNHHHDDGLCCSKLCNNISYADWFMLKQLGTNMDPVAFRLLIESYCHQTRYRDRSNEAVKVQGKMLYDGRYALTPV